MSGQCNAFCGILGRVALDAICDQDHLTASHAGLLQEFQGLKKPEVCAAALGRHDGGLQCTELGPDSLCIPCKGGDRERIARENDQACQSLFITGEDILDLEACALDPCRFEILCEHRTGEVEDDDLRRICLHQRLWLAFPGRIGQGEYGNQPAGSQQPEGQAGVRSHASVHQQGLQVRIDDPAPWCVSGLPPCCKPEQQDEGQQRQQPGGFEKMKQDVALLRHSASSPGGTFQQVAVTAP